MHTDARLVPGRVRLLSVQAPEDIEYLVKESEVLTGRSGRTFVIAFGGVTLGEIKEALKRPAKAANAPMTSEV